jgi:glucosamine--fructose-6-phosphate aminotransferase (isomerizing)
LKKGLDKSAPHAINKECMKSVSETDFLFGERAKVENMTHFLQDILRQPVELRDVIHYLCTAGRSTLRQAAELIRSADHVYMTGIGSSWHAALSAAPVFFSGARPVYLQDAAELLHFAVLPRNAVVIAISRTGRSIEIVQLLAKVRESGGTVIALTNSDDGPLAREAQIPLVVPTTFDHGISVNTYSSLAAAAGALAMTTAGSFDDAFATSLSRALADTARAIPDWQEQIALASWLSPGAVCYFLARGSSLASCHETRLLWEEAAKAPATAMETSSFRHGPQEMVAKGTRFGIWVDGQCMREQDLAVAQDLRRLGASVMLIGQDLKQGGGDLVLRLPQVPSGWQFLIDIIPAQLAAERFAHLSGVDCDTFRYCSYLVEGEYGLLHEEMGKS